MLNVDQFLFTLHIMLKGMGGIFIVTLVIICAIALLNAAGKKKAGKGPSDAK